MSEPVPLQTALTDVVRAQRLIEAFYSKIRGLLAAAEEDLARRDPPLVPVPCPGHDLFSPTYLGLQQPEAWLRRWLAVFFAEPRFLAASGLPAGATDLKLAYLLVNIDPQTVAEAELDLVLLHDVQGVQGPLPSWLDLFWNRGTFDLDVPADGWYGRAEPISLGPGASFRLQLQRVPLHRVDGLAALHREVTEPLHARYRSVR